MIARLPIAFLLGAVLISAASVACGQSFVPRRSRPAEQLPESRSASVSQDLLELHSKTKAADSETSLTAIARGCSKVIPDTARSQVDRDYAASLLAWALNRRGELRNERAEGLVAEGSVDEAAELDRLAAEDFETAVKYAPENWRTRHNLGISLAMNGNYRAAIAELSKTIKLQPSYANAHFNRGELYFELEQFAQAIDDYSAAIELNPSDPQFYNSRAHGRFMLESWDAALADYQQAAELAADSAVYQTDLADAYQYVGRWDEAAQAYRAAVAINNKYPRAYQNAAWLMATCPDAKLRNVELARTAAQKAIDLGAGRTPQTLDTLAAATAAAGKHAEAAKLARLALGLSSDPDEKAELLSRLKLYEQGRAYVQPGKQATPKVRTASGSSKL